MFGYGPLVCFIVIAIVIFILWLFWGGKNYEMVGLRPFDTRNFDQYHDTIHVPPVRRSQDARPADPQSTNPPVNSPTNLPINPSVNPPINPNLGNTQNPDVCPTIKPPPKLPEPHTDTVTIEPCHGKKSVKFEPEPQIVKIEEIKSIDLTPIVPRVLEAKQMPVLSQRLVIDGEIQNIAQPKVQNGRVSAGEKICAITMEKIYNKPFRRVRPNFLKNPETGRNLELDCYNEELKLAVEYNGIQHYVWPNWTGHSQEEFQNQVRRDKLKHDLCNQNGIYLITVPYNVDHSMIADYIRYYLPENVMKRQEEARDNVSGLPAI